MNIKQVKKPEKRVDVRYLAKFNIKTYGDDNLYPQNVDRVVSSSSTGGLCLRRFKRFVFGGGFTDATFAASEVNLFNDTANDVLLRAVDDFTRFGGFALHVNYNLECKVTDVTNVPFQNCRLTEGDDRGYISKIAIHPDWSGEATRNGKKLKVDESSVEKLNVFNPDTYAVLEQIESAGGINHYKGQIFYYSSAGNGCYPTPIYDDVLTELVTDEGISNVKMRNVKNNFFPSGMYVVKKSSEIKTDEEGNEVEERIDYQEYNNIIKDLQGDMEAAKMLLVAIEDNEDIPQFVEFPTRNFDKEFEVTEVSTTERIYGAFEQEPFYCIRIGKVGFSGNTTNDAYYYYSSITKSERDVLARVFAKIFEHFNIELNATKNYAIKELKYMEG